MKTKLIATMAILALSACDHPLEIISKGDIISASGTRNCLYEDHQIKAENCTRNVVTGDYQETYTAIPHSGYKFDRWANFCKNDLSNTCSFDIASDVVEQFEGETATPLVAKFRKETTGYNSLFIGHSFFRPFAESMTVHAANNGLTTHDQSVVFSGGASGAPEALWNDKSKRAEIQAELNVGDIELFGMTYHPDYPGIRGYKLWIDYALAQNSETKFFLALPWGTQPANYAAEDYHEGWKASLNDEIHGLIDLARSQYPNVEFYVIPYGQAAGELYTRYANGQLPDVETLTSTNRPSIFRDSLGHASPILLDLGELVWLYSIYGIRPAAYDYDPGYITDLRAIAEDIVIQHNPYYDAQ